VSSANVTVTPFMADPRPIQVRYFPKRLAEHQVDGYECPR